MSEQNIRQTHIIANENYRDATRYIDEKLAMDPTGRAGLYTGPVQLPNNGYAHRSGSFDRTPEGTSVHASEVSEAGTINSIYTRPIGHVTSSTSGRSEKGAPYVGYDARTSIRGVDTTVSRQHKDAETGEYTNYKHVFKSPEAAKLVTKLAMKRIDGYNPDAPKSKKDAA